ncbi:hypothetical protein DVH24_008929 [Malus domestica]|uniref:Uncharacterized protein n=1 Tax=Malus domestica TaxID=3750 RepID=A0A498JMX9_MALDO|nr:hypothetical protein DVH24_008929 [Malus domestica]
MGKEKRHQMMQNLFGDQSEEEEEEVDSEHESNPQPNSDEGEGALDAEGEGEVEGQGEVEAESDGEQRNADPDPGESEGEREQSSQEVDIGDHREESEGKYTDNDEKEELTSRRRNVIESGSERSMENHYLAIEDEVNQARSPRSPEEEEDHNNIAHSAVHNVFGDSDEKEEEEETDYAVRNDIQHESNRSPMEEEGNYGKSPRLEDVMPEEDNIEAKPRDKPVGPPLELEIPLRPPPACPEKSQGRVLKKMRFMPSSLTSNSHRLLTALVDSRHKKVYKVKNCVTDIDPEREKEEKERAESQNIRANLLLNRKKEKVSRKYTTTGDRRRQLSPGFLEDALDELITSDFPDEEPNYHKSRRSRRHMEEDFEMEARREKRILNAKKTDEEDEEPRRKMAEDSEPEYEDSEEHHDAEVNDASEEEEAEGCPSSV